MRNRSGANHLIDRIHEDEWKDVMEVVAGIFERNGLDIARTINEVNAERVTKA